MVVGTYWRDDLDNHGLSKEERVRRRRLVMVTFDAYMKHK
jgi:hypothetical protein